MEPSVRMIILVLGRLLTVLFYSFSSKNPDQCHIDYRLREFSTDSDKISSKPIEYPCQIGARSSAHHCNVENIRISLNCQKCLPTYLNNKVPVVESFFCIDQLQGAIFLGTGLFVSPSPSELDVLFNSERRSVDL